MQRSKFTSLLSIFRWQTLQLWHLPKEVCALLQPEGAPQDPRGRVPELAGLTRSLPEGACRPRPAAAAGSPGRPVQPRRGARGGGARGGRGRVSPRISYGRGWRAGKFKYPSKIWRPFNLPSIIAANRVAKVDSCGLIWTNQTQMSFVDTYV